MIRKEESVLSNKNKIHFTNENYERSIPVTRKTRQLKKEEPHDKIEVHLAGCNNPIKPEVHHELYTE